MYDYREAMTEDVKQWITDEVNLADWTETEKDSSNS